MHLRFGFSLIELAIRERGELAQRVVRELRAQQAPGQLVPQESPEGLERPARLAQELPVPLVLPVA